MAQRRYYSVRTGKNKLGTRFDLSTFRRLFRDLFASFLERDFFQEAFGYHCVDAGDVPGTLGYDIEAQMFRRLRKPDLWPILDKCTGYSEDDLFDVLEFLLDYVSKPTEGSYHEYSQCGWHYNKFDRRHGRAEFRQEANEILNDYGVGYLLSFDGEILVRGERGLHHLFEAEVPSTEKTNVVGRVNAAIAKFRRFRSTADDRRDAVRDLADVLEYLRPKAKRTLTRKDEADLFQIANNFGIRHHNDKQQTDYDQGVWYSWMFYYYLATIHACLRLSDRVSTP